MASSELNMPLVGEKWKLVTDLGTGYFAKEFHGRPKDRKDTRRLFIKIASNRFDRLTNEQYILMHLFMSGAAGAQQHVPHVLYKGSYGKRGEDLWALITTIRGHSVPASSFFLVASHRESGIRKFGAETLTALEKIHEERVIHRDIRPRNLGANHAVPFLSSNTVTLLYNFGNARYFKV